MLKSEIEKIDKYEYVSFDIFETLIRRDVQQPKDIFELVEVSYNNNNSKIITNFKKNRVEVEKLLRQLTLNEEITFDEIYDKLKEFYPNEIVEKLKEEEIKIELELCHRNLDVEDIYEYCISKSKKIIIASDMYFNKNVIEKILDSNNIKYDKLYLSSELNKTKRTGNMFKYILEDLKINNNQIVHIGDNINSDIRSTNRFRIDNIQVKYDRKLKYYNENHIPNKYKFEYKTINSFINNNLDKNNSYYFNMGYETLGPLLYAYSIWLKKQFSRNRYNSICFLARDGYIMKKAYEIVDNITDTKYLYASRRALTVPTLWLCNNFREMADTMHFSSQISMKALLQKLGLNAEEYQDILKKYKYDINEFLDTKKIINDNKFISFFDEIKNDIIENSKQEYCNLISYLSKNNFNNDVAIIDIGWYGNMQKALEKIIKNSNLNVKLSGYYVGVVPSSKNQEKFKMNGFLFEKNKNEDLFWKKKYFNSIFEMVFLAHHGSTMKYNENNVDLYEYEYENTDTEKFINELQSGALEFVKDFYSSNLKKYIEIDEYLSMFNLLEFGNNPSLEDIDKFGNMKFYDDDYVNIIEKKSLLYYVTHPQKFIKAFSNSYWKTGFLKSCLKIKLPYYSIVLFIRNKILKKDEV